jgi:hypothetical protein
MSVSPACTPAGAAAQYFRKKNDGIKRGILKIINIFGYDITTIPWNIKEDFHDYHQ